MNPSLPGNSHFLDDPEHVRNMVYGLMFECPLGGNPNDCPAFELRHEPAQERVQFVKGMSDEECRDFYRRHLACLNAKSQ